MRPLNNLNMIGALIAIIFINVNFGNKAGSPPALAFNYYPYIRNGNFFINNNVFTITLHSNFGIVNSGFNHLFRIFVSGFYPINCCVARNA